MILLTDFYQLLLILMPIPNPDLKRKQTKREKKKKELNQMTKPNQKGNGFEER